MIKIYVSPACLGCRQAIAFFKKHGIEYTEKDFTKSKLTRQELIDILSISENGFDDILSIRSNTYKRHKEDLDDFTVNQIIDLIIRYPEILSRPIIIQYKNNIPFRLLIGYNSNDIEIFLREVHERQQEQELKDENKDTHE